ncbi:MAG: LSU ribosomal protein L29p (L35e) [uncultured Acidimicrobiales bacterium]|uniref:Large ribosomal subunit protein uL29 n=1 Tax=uncultured Acidimicrobiales bacterium TaxID=310071 RepID=A0A6J4HYN8_9ACTN|nr:MAG: LSU ribosomal protein L29p (L35e) [uncultured Acidimicrobiales bacterium]
MPITTVELRELSEDELLDRLAEVKQDVFTLRFQIATGQAENTSLLGVAKRDVARILTILRERQIAAAEAGAE